MANRDITFSIKVQNDAKRSIAAFKKDLVNLKSSLKSVSSQLNNSTKLSNKFAGSVNSLAKSTKLVNTEFNNFTKKNKFESSFNSLNSTTKKVSTQFKVTTKTTKEFSNSLNKLSLSAKKAQIQLKSLTRVNAEFKKLSASSQKVATKLAITTGNTKKLGNSMRVLSKNVRKATHDLNTFENQGQNTSNTLDRLKGFAATAFTTFATVSAIKDFASFEEGLINVAKTANLSQAELAVFGDEIQKLAPKLAGSSQELLAIATAAGQLGVKGSDNLLKFTDTISRLQVASDIGGEEAALALSRILNITGEGAGNVDRFASTVVALGNEFAALESEIVRVSNEVARSTTEFGLSSAEIAGISTSLRAVGVQAEIGGSAIGRTFRAIDKSVRDGGNSIQNLSAITGIAVQDLKQQFQINATSVFQKFIEGLAKIQKEGGSTTEALAKFKLKGEEILKVIPPLAKNSEDLGRALRLASQEAANPTALFIESEKAAKSLTQTYKNFGDSVATISQKLLNEFAPILKSVLIAATEFLTSIAQNETAMNLLASAVIGLTSAFATFIAIKAVSSLAGIALAIGGVSKAVTLLSTAVRANPIGLLVSGVAIAVTSIISFRGEVNKTANKINTLKKEIDNSTKELIKNNTIYKEAIKSSSLLSREKKQEIVQRRLNTIQIRKERLEQLKTIKEQERDRFLSNVSELEEKAKRNEEWGSVLIKTAEKEKEQASLAQKAIQQLNEQIQFANQSAEELQTELTKINTTTNNNSSNDKPLGSIDEPNFFNATTAAKAIEELFNRTRTSQEAYRLELTRLNELRPFAKTQQDLEAIDRAITALNEKQKPLTNPEELAAIEKLNGLFAETRTEQELIALKIQELEALRPFASTTQQVESLNRALAKLKEDPIETASVQKLNELITQTRTENERYLQSLQELDELRPYAKTQQQLEALDRATKNLKENYNGFVDSSKEGSQEIESALNQVKERGINALSDALGNFVETGKFDFNSLKQVALDAALQIGKSLLFGGQQESSGGLFGGGDSGGGLFAGLFANGGKSNSPSQGAIVSPDLFTGARRFKNGGKTPSMGGRGIPAILHSDERVLNRRETQAYEAGGRNNIIVNINLSGVTDANSFKRSEGQIGASTGRAIQSALDRYK